MYYGIISQLYKGKGDRLERANWHPLTMLNVDYKILAKVLTTRISAVMDTLVHSDQTCAVPGRDIRDGVLHLYNLVETAICKHKSAILLSIDHMAAFDIIEWDFIKLALQSYGLGPTKFIHWFSINL